TTIAPPADLDLRTRVPSGPLTADMKRFDVFLIDTGWNAAVSKLIHSQLPVIHQYLKHDNLYVLSTEQSVGILKGAPEFIGHDPTLLLYDLYAVGDTKQRIFHGFRLHLGLFRRPEQAMARLQEFLRFLVLHRTASCLSVEVRRELHREGAKGMIKILREASTELL